MKDSKELSFQARHYTKRFIEGLASVIYEALWIEAMKDKFCVSYVAGPYGVNPIRTGYRPPAPF